MSFSKEKLHIKFREEYNKLNERQRKAVDTIEGPVIVNAGPGTGKTQILALRIANILQQTDIDAGNILCLTYTDNGAVEMRNRLLKIVGSTAYKIQIHTFHSFCNEVIQDNLTWFGKLNLEPIGDLEEIDLFYRLIDSIEKDNILKRFRGEVYYEKDRLKELYRLMKKEAWTPEYLNERIDGYLKELPQKEGFYYKRKFKEFKAGDEKPGAIAEETQKMEMLRAAVNLYPRYNRLMLEAGRYNFDDMILWVLDAFANNKNMLLDYQERFQYFLVDEFQDTSRGQNLLLQYLTGYWNDPNVFVVGDPDQSIFSFQDANVQNILAFEEKYTGNIVKINLTHNYRSAQNILDTAHTLIRNNNTRTISIENSDPLISANHSLRGMAIEPHIYEYANSTQEAIDVVLQIEALVQQGMSGREIAVIYRNHAQVAEMITLLEVKKIPVNIKRKVDILQLPFITNIISLLTWIDKESYIPYSADDILFQLLHTGFFRLPPLDVAKLSVAVNAKNRSSKDDVYAIRRLLSEMTVPPADLFNQSNGYSFKEISNTLESLLQAAGNVTLQHLFELVIQKAGILSFVMQSAEKPWLMQVLNAFFSFIKEETRHNPALNLHELLVNIETIRKNRLGIPLYKVNAAEEGVNLVTAHGSKGSEYAHVFVIGATRDIWDDTKAGNKSYKLPDNLVSNTNIPASLEENRRLFYVAITRAKTHLNISYALKNAKDKEQVRSSFVTEIQEGTGLPSIQKQVPDELLTEYLALQFAEKARPEIELMEEEYIDQLLKKYTLSVTHLNNYLNCPLKFYYQNLIRVPAAKNENMTFGSAVHYAVEMLFKKMKNNNDIFPGKDSLLADFTFFMQTNREALTPEEYKRRSAYGEKILPAYYDYHISRWTKVIIAEKAVRNVVVQNVPVNGKLDKLEFNGKQVNVVDYKTGKYENGRKKLVAPNEKEPNGGDYWRQAVFYKILLDNFSESINKGWEVVSTEFDFLEPVNDEYKVEKVLITDADITTVTHQITDTWQKIQRKEFKTGCGKADCEWCNFVKNNNLAVALHAPEADDTEV
ncbi:ATP-dependent DNA helicase [Agriterribacter sp.]|uniref:ATP-dependent helicase n=1 Tax=Agriterribacter sp. TaxID=2821509 RepID=UPI002B97C5BD|nr:ATP-dependent DNA helicase [Agriterribacter sp.]HRO45652.1 ATP-dependent DNA helicase [Agriterribacter sp.]HRQ17473.1 ATP-dependent DNA helicase [Agriterribacter sp.]